MKKFLVGLVFLSSTAVFAAGGSEARTPDMYAPKSSGAEFVVGLTLHTGKYEKSPSSTTASGMDLGLEYGYGFSDVMAVYVAQGYRNTEYTTDPGSFKSKITGIGDTKVGLKAVIDYGQVFFYYDVGYQMGLLAKAKTNSSGEATGVSRRPFLEAQGGVGTSIDMFGVGALITFDMYQDGDSDVDVAGTTFTTKNKSGNGMQWKLYAQYQSTFKAGLAYGEQTIDAFDTTTASVTTPGVKAEGKMISVYGIIPVGTASEIHLQLQKPESKTGGGTYSFYDVSAAYRMMF